MRQFHRVDRLGDEINDRLIGGQVTLGSFRESNGPLDYEVAVISHGLIQLCRRGVPPMILCVEEIDFVAYEDGELALELELGLGERLGNDQDGGAEDTLECEGTYQHLEIGRETEGDRIAVVEERLPLDHGGYELGAPDFSSAARNEHSAGSTIAHVHDVRHECQAGKLIRKLPAEQPEVGKIRVDGLKIVDDEIVRHILCLDRLVVLQANVLSLIRRFLCMLAAVGLMRGMLSTLTGPSSRSLLIVYMMGSSLPIFLCRQ